MEPEEPLIQGILLLPPQGMLGQLKKTWHKRFCQLFRTSNYGIKRVEIYDNQEEAILQLHTPRIITLDACIKIAPSNQSHVFTVVTKSGIHYFGCYSESDMSHWITAFQLVAFKDSVSNQTIEENNDLYCTSGEGVFSVKVVETDASKRCGLESRNYTLVVAAVDIKLMDGDVVLFTWPYRYIRRYGYKDGKFIFEAGRKCESGEGSFRLEHSSQHEIFRCMYSKMRSMKKLMNEESSPSIDCNDAQYHAALSMEAGSRAALPPSPNSSANLIDIDFSPQNSQKHSTSSSNLDSSISTKPSSSIGKSKPAKPPRKCVFTGLLDKKNVDPELSDSSACGEYKALNRDTSPELSQKTIGSSILDDEEKHPYDLVEVRNDAWKTHGIDNIHHTERPNSLLHNDKNKENEDDFQYETMMPFMSSQSSSKSTKKEQTNAEERVGQGRQIRRAAGQRNARRRMQANTNEQEVHDEDASDGNDEADEKIVVLDHKIGAKKRAKLVAKAEKKVQREAAEREREERKKREQLLQEERDKQYEKEREEELRQEEAERKAREEKERREYEEYIKMKEAFSVEEEGYEQEDRDEEENLLQAFVQYIQENKVVVLEDLAAHFGLKTISVVERIQELQTTGTLTGVIDDRGKFIYISQEELEAVAKFVRQRGRVSITELVENSNNLINLSPVKQRDMVEAR
nr:PREDICTED: uncharacterized protein LOC100880615 isoform X1 [Megachile rotundata]XP_012146778.1 PREDICTED: uncharacterized protein LOC100880615 isoform X1 [Megachile rotundata]